MDWLSYPAASDRILSMIGIEIHWAILQYIIGLSLLAAITNVIWHKTKKIEWFKISRTLTKGFVIVFAVGAAMGTAAEFGLVLLWPNLMVAAGRYIYFPLYIEIFAFLMEVVFIYMFWIGWKKLPAKAHVIVGFLAFGGALFSAAMIMSVNSYMQAPPGIIPASDNGEYLYDKGYPKLILYVPNEIVSALDVEKLKSINVEILGKTEDSVIVAMPVLIVKQLIADSFDGKTVKESILFNVLNSEAQEKLKDVSVFTIVDAIVINTVKNIGVYTITFQSPVYVPSFLHTFFAALTVSAFTVTAGYGLSLKRKNSDHARLGFKFGSIVALVTIIIQGAVTGHEMGVAVAEWNPEKFAAMESGTPEFLEGWIAFLAYGNFSAKIPEYSAIPDELKPPNIVFHLYYLKITLAVFLTLLALYVTYSAWKDRKVSSILLISVPVIVQMVSFLGWTVREIGRKPWTIYGIMDVQTAHTMNPPSPGEAAAIALYLILIAVVLLYAVYRFLWKEV